MLRCQDLTVTAGTRVLVRNLTLALEPGQRIAILGPNGAGKSLTLLSLAGLRPPASGTVLLAGTPLGSQSRRTVALQLGLLLQAEGGTAPGTVADAVLLGRFAHHGPWQAPGASDEAQAAAALAALELQSLAGRSVESLSGGEQRRVAIARLLAQAPPLMLLDEPLNHLDPAHVVRVARELKALAGAGRVGLLVSLHDAMLARQLADTALFLHGDGRWELGPVDDLITAARLETLFGTPYRGYHGPDGEVFAPAA